MPRSDRIVRLTWLALLAIIAAPAVASAQQRDADAVRHRGVIGPKSNKVKQEDGKTYLWAGGDPNSADAQWYDFTEARIPAAELQFGIGKDSIRAIDDPLFVSPDDQRLLEIGGSPYRREGRPKTTNDIKVLGYVEGDQARAYPVALLDRHELVNDKIGGKPVTVGW